MTNHEGFTHRLAIQDVPGPEQGVMIRYGRRNPELARSEFLRLEVFGLRSAGCYAELALSVQRAGDGDPVSTSVDLPTEVLRGIAVGVLLSDRQLRGALSKSFREFHDDELRCEALGRMARGLAVPDYA